MTTDEFTVTSMRLTAVFAKPDDARLMVARLDDEEWAVKFLAYRLNTSRITWETEQADPAAYFEAACTAVGFYGSTLRHKATVTAEFDGVDGPVMWGPRACRYVT